METFEAWPILQGTFFLYFCIQFMKMLFLLSSLAECIFIERFSFCCHWFSFYFFSNLQTFTICVCMCTEITRKNMIFFIFTKKFFILFCNLEDFCEHKIEFDMQILDFNIISAVKITIHILIYTDTTHKCTF